MKSPDYRYILVRLLDKMRRTHQYYLATSNALGVKTRRPDLSPRDLEVAAARKESVDRCAHDIGYLYERATEKLTGDDILEIETFNKQDYHDRHHSLPKAI